ncbi:MAG: DHH family phosphoesterase [Bacteroidales bacterium]|nr:DHH family phosphoesterase [Bacteroidales bacterium]
MVPCITDSKLKEFRQMMDGAERITVLGHTHPDGDAIGSTTALCVCLRDILGKSPVLIFPDTPADNLLFIPDSGIPCIYADKSPSEALSAIEGSDTIILLDCRSFSRIEQLGAPCRAASARKILIDHHLDPQEDEFNLVFSTPDISSASELLYWILTGIFGRALPEKAREAILTGMTTDTNNFANSVFPSTMQMASELIADGTDRDKILNLIYNCYRENRIRLMGYMQCNEMRLLPEGVAYMVLTKDIQERFGYREGETEGLVNVPLTIGTVRMSILATEKDGLFRISVRSKKGTSAQNLAVRFFRGGGHENAAGGKIILGEDVPSAALVPSYIENSVKTFFAL